MVAVIRRHPFPTENAEAALTVLKESADGWIGGLEADSTGLGEALETTLLVAKVRCLTDPRGSVFPTWDAWVNAIQVGSAVFAAATAAEDQVPDRARGPYAPGHRPAAVCDAGYLADRLPPGRRVP